MSCAVRLWALLISLLIGLPAFGLDAPPLTGRVVDLAEILSPQAEQRIIALSEELERGDSTQLAVLTVPSLEGDTLEDFSIRVVDAWKLGRSDVDNGVLLLVARDDRQVRIEVGYGLEGKLTDLLAGRIIAQEIIPRFRQGDFDGGILAGVQAIAQTVRGEYQAPPESPQGRKRGLPGGALFIFVIIVLFNMLRGPRGPRPPGGITRGRRMGRRGGPIIFGGPGGFGGGGFGGGGFSGGGGGFGGGGASGRW